MKYSSVPELKKKNESDVEAQCLKEACRAFKP